MGNRPSPGDRPGVGDRPGPGGRQDLRQDRVQQRHDRGQNIRNDFRHNHPRWDFWKGNPNWARWRYNRPYRWATWAAVTGWFTWGSSWGTPYYYDYGTTVVYQNDQVYVEGEPVATAEEYADQAIALADTGARAVEQAASQQQDVEWMPLGVFALAHEEDGDPIMFLQLAVSKEGLISGTYFNSSSENTLPVQGSVDKSSQRAAWTIGDNESTVLETGIYNLTKDETPVLVHFDKEKTQTWLMVRLEDPEPEATQ